MRCPLTSLNSENYLAHDFELLPVDPEFVLAHEGFVAFFCGNQVTAVQREEWDSLGE